MSVRYSCIKTSTFKTPLSSSCPLFSLFVLSFTHTHRCEQIYILQPLRWVNSGLVYFERWISFSRQWVQAQLSKADEQLTNDNMARICLLALVSALLLEVHGLSVEIAARKTGKQPRMGSENTGGTNDRAWSLPPTSQSNTPLKTLLVLFNSHGDSCKKVSLLSIHRLRIFQTVLLLQNLSLLTEFFFFWGNVVKTHEAVDLAAFW